MGLEILITAGTSPTTPEAAFRVASLLRALSAEGFPTTIMMVDGALVLPTAPPPHTWRDLRLRTPAGTITLARRPTGYAVVVFGNAAPALVDAQSRIAAVLRQILL